MDQLRNDSQRKAESTSAHRVALGQQQELEPESLEQQLKSNEACGYERGTIGVLSQAIEGARLRKWEISRECFNLVCGALQIPCDDGCNGSFQGKKFILVLYIKTDPFTNLTPCVHQHDPTVTFAAATNCDDGSRAFFSLARGCPPWPRRRGASTPQV